MAVGRKQQARRRLGEAAHSVRKAIRYLSELSLLFGKNYQYQTVTLRCVSVVLEELLKILLDLAVDTWGEAYDTVESLRK